MKVLWKIKRVFSSSYAPVPRDSRPLNEPRLISGWKREFNLENLTDPSQAEAHKDAFAMNVALLSEEIEYCKARNWHPVFVIPPVPSETRKYISNEFAKAFVYDNIKPLNNKYPDVHVLDYFADDRLKSEMFNGDIFLNAEDRKTFSQILFADIDKEHASCKYQRQD